MARSFQPGARRLGAMAAAILSARPVLGTAIFLLTVLAVITRPRGIPEWASALAGAAVAILLGLIPAPAAIGAIRANWNVLAFFVGITGLAAVADRSGFFERVGRLALVLAAGSGRRLLVAVLLLGAVITTFLSNDATALILTPVVYGLVVGLGIEALPYVLACTFIADTASLMLPISNPANLLVSDAFDLPLDSYVGALGLASVVAVMLNVVLFLWIFRRSVPRRIRGPREVAAVSELRLVWAGLTVVAAAFVIGGLAHLPLGIVACVGFVLLLVLEAIGRRAPYRRPLEGVSWPVLGFVSGMVVLVAALEQLGVVDRLVASGLSATRGSPILSGATASAMAAVGSNLVNNIPMTLLMIAGIQSAGLHGATRDAAAFGTIIGADLGPNLTTVGSLATVLWLVILRRRGLDVRPWDYMRVGLLVTPPILVAATLTMLFTFR